MFEPNYLMLLDTFIIYFWCKSMINTYPVDVGASLSDIPGGVVLVGAAFNLYESCVFVLVSET